MRIAVVGCGYVVDDYLRTLPEHPEITLVGVTDLDESRSRRVAARYGVRCFATTEELLADPSVELVVNLTHPQTHHEISRAALLAGKHVYSEKPLSLAAEDAQDLAALARERGLMLSGAPCNLLGASWAAVRRLVRDGAIGRTRVIYAELDDNPIYLMHPEEWRSESGTPWPFKNEYEVGCTLEHAAYHVAALAALFGPVREMTSFASCLVPDKSPVPLDPPTTPDFSVACLTFDNGVVARLTCSIVATYDHKVRLIGDEGEVVLDEVWHNRSPVSLERFGQMSLNARKLRAVRHNPLLGRLVGVGGRNVRYDVPAPVQASEPESQAPRGRGLSFTTRLKGALRRRQMTSLDFLLGISDMEQARREGRDPLITPEFLLHVSEVTLAISSGDSEPRTIVPPHSFTPLALDREEGTAWRPAEPGPLAAVTDRVLVALHRRGGGSGDSPSAHQPGAHGTEVGAGSR
ncbi:Gfo/Idh/MocA family protein [Microlunatus flavus]|uniref:Predicted dehydrogenase n=1 Tax=Microlunatus flavus TaxID=1036181 RepID=A0A1H9CLQ8_9ACTN|nr:Gfo/Idh/MocA family oxidoreductase [Microlunatus flavus]SEQ02140.1 Predicted dehydrogenase [Microlunatus flavus]